MHSEMFDMLPSHVGS